MATLKDGKVKLTKLDKAKIDEAGQLHKEIADKTERLKLLKAELTTSVYEVGIKAAIGDRFSVTFTDTETFADIKPADAYKALKALNIEGKFYSCVKVQVGPTAKLLPGADMAKIRKSTGFQPRIVFTSAV